MEGCTFFHYIKQSARFPSTEPSYSQRAQWISSVLVCGNHGHRYLPSSRAKSKFRKANYTMSCDLKKRLYLFMSSLQKREVRSREFRELVGGWMGGLLHCGRKWEPSQKHKGPRLAPPPPCRPQNVSSQRYSESCFIGVCALIPTVIKKPCLSFINILFLSRNKFPQNYLLQTGWLEEAVCHPPLAPGPGHSQQTR